MYVNYRKTTAQNNSQKYDYQYLITKMKEFAKINNSITKNGQLLFFCNEKHSHQV